MGIDHVGLGVPDIEVAKAYYDEFMPLVGFVRDWEVGYRPLDHARDSHLRASADRRGVTAAPWRGESELQVPLQDDSVPTDQTVGERAVMLRV